MKFTPTPIANAFLIEWEGFSDHRGSFSRTFCAHKFREHGINPHVAQANLCITKQKGTIRGLHYQIPPAVESKLIRCVRGKVYDVIVDLRPDSPSFLKHFAVELSAENRRSLYIPPLCAHGYQTLVDDTELIYQTGGFYSPEHERGLRYNDPSLKIKWPIPLTCISEKDANWPLLGKVVEPSSIPPTTHLV